MKLQNEFEEKITKQLKTIIIAWSFNEVSYGSVEKVFLEAIREAREDTTINILGLYYAVVKDLYGEEIAKLIQSKVNSH